MIDAHNRFMDPKTRLGRFEILSAIGAGGMGEVFKARDTRLDRNVAIKILPAHFARNPESLARLEREARAISQLNHPHICTLYDVGHEEGLTYLVMEYIHGQSLARTLRVGPLPVDQVLRYGAQIADALSHAHASGMIHRDLKPANVMITGTSAKLLDFGLAKVVNPTLMADEGSTTKVAEATLTAEGAIVGTVQYMSPEQLQSREVGTGADIFALGMVLFEMATGRRAFEGDSQAGIIAAILKSEPPSAQSLVPAVPPALDRLISRCLQKDPAQRWQSARDLADELRWILQERTSGQRVVPPARQLRRWLWPVLVAVVVVASAGLFVWRNANGGRLPDGPPRLILMDSTNPERVYSSITRANGATNADDLTNLLRDLPVTLMKENTSAFWNREDQIVKETPDLIVLHRGAFAPSKTMVPDARVFQYTYSLGQGKVEAFVGYVGLANTRTRFIVYSRQWDDIGGGPRWVSSLENRFPHLRGRVSTIDVTGAPEPSFRDPACAARTRKDVVRALGLPGH
jgi:serine/threonine protein kinase